MTARTTWKPFSSIRRRWRGREIPPEPEAPTVSGAPLNSAAGTASALHAFNRFEIKYLVPQSEIPLLREELRGHLDTDEHADDGSYSVTSVYYDTAELKFYWEKLEGLRFRRKLRIRKYGPIHETDHATDVFVEVKQRVNRVTQKRRIALPYDQALRLCAGDGDELLQTATARERAFIDEVVELVGRLDLRPVVTTAYQREAYLGRDADLGLRVTLDHRLRGRDRDFSLMAETENRFTLPPDLAVLELKANERVPYWATDLMARMDLQVVRISKYCQSVEAFGLAPRSLMHRPEDVAQLLRPHEHRPRDTSQETLVH